MKNINLTDFKFSTPLEMRWNDMDALGHINNVFYFDYFQNARGFYMDQVSKTWNWNKDMFIIAHIECDYFRELKLTAREPELRVRTSILSNKSFELEYLILSKSSDGNTIIHTKGKSVQVMYDMINKKTFEIPDWLRAEIIDYELGIE
ncbi:MAG: thioesterase family protein [Saprospiraceae bacterium]